MKLESDLALEEARDRRNRARNGLEPALQGSVDAPRLTGVYGVGSRLFAEVRSSGRTYLFRNGVARPLGQGVSDSPFRLKQVVGKCVRLVHEGNDLELCLSAGAKK